MKKHILILMVLSAVLSSCCQKKRYCTSGTLDFAFTGFPRSEVRSFTLRRFVKGDQWGKPLDSAQFIYSGSAPLTTKPDTLYFSEYRTIGNLSGITAGNDWAIYLPATGKVYFVTDVFENDNRSQLVRCNDKETSCVMEIRNFSINNKWQNGSFVYIPKGEW